MKVKAYEKGCDFLKTRMKDGKSNRTWSGVLAKALNTHPFLTG